MDQEELSERFFEFAVRIGRIVRALGGDPLSRQIAYQLSKSGTAPAPHYEEACACESRKDFIHKLSICLKELKESRFWIKLIIRSDLLMTFDVPATLDECEQLGRIIGKSIVTTKRNAKG